MNAESIVSFSDSSLELPITKSSTSMFPIFHCLILVRQAVCQPHCLWPALGVSPHSLPVTAGSSFPSQCTISGQVGLKFSFIYVATVPWFWIWAWCKVSLEVEHCCVSKPHSWATVVSKSEPQRLGICSLSKAEQTAGVITFILLAYFWFLVFVRKSGEMSFMPSFFSSESDNAPACASPRAEPIFGSATRFSRVSATRQYSVLSHHKPAETEC